MVLNFDDELNFQDYSSTNDNKQQHQQQQRSRKPDSCSSTTASINQDHHSLGTGISTHVNIDFSAAEWEYLTNHCIPPSAYDANGMEISPSISSQTLQLLRPSFCSEYDTDTTDIMGFVDQHNQQHQLTLQLHQSVQLHQHQTLPPQQHQLQHEEAKLLHIHHRQEQLQHSHTTGNNTTTQKSKPTDDFCFPSNLDYNIFLENIMDKENLVCERSFTSATGDGTCSTPIFNPENYDQELYMLQQELQENNIPLEHYQPQSIENNDEEDEDDFMAPSSDLLATATTTAVSATTATLLILLMLLVKSPSQVFVDFDDFVTSPIYEWPSDETGGHVNLTNNMKVRLANLEPKTVSDAVRKTIREEFIIQDLFLNGQSPLPPEIPKSIRKKSDRDVEWTPLSVYKAYTNIKSPANGKEAYNHLVPYTSCIGTLNYRPKDHAAWKRAPNRRR
ncbi:hypothetical protein Cantr_02969 [Candida viswanathii]|uniref:Uncharacterized protein n=1 Tax=Candida viswanathii TaxID=5486 RepID=A0A367YN46_9ASCO|nr:hypothetical protein Cantr_02969 [Candida viswanathii]